MESACLEKKKKKKSMSSKVLILTIDSQNNKREGSIEFDGFLLIKITSVILITGGGDILASLQALLLDMCRTVRLELGSWLDLK